MFRLRLVWATLLAAIASTATAAPPNFVIFVVDDLGYADLQSYGHPEIETPRLDALAAEGQRWTNFYAASPLCSPSRAAILTGKLPIRTGMYGTRVGVLFPGAKQGLPPEVLTVAEALKLEGYATALLGKWHLGDGPDALPTRHGFDFWYGIPYSNDMNQADGIDYFDLRNRPPGERKKINARRTTEVFAPRSEYWNVPLIRSNANGGNFQDTVLETSTDQALLTKRITHEAVGFIERNAEKPFLLFVMHPMPHTPIFASEDFSGKSRAGRYGDVVEELDWSAGYVVDALRDLSLEENTLVMFTSDNGPWLTMKQHGGSAGPLRDGKGTTFEGGVRVPAIFSWPGKISPGTVRDIGSGLDVMPTLLSLAGATPASEMDGYDLSSTLLERQASPRKVLPYYRDGELYAYRFGPYKLHLITEGAYGQPPERQEHNPPLLFHLGNDPAERFNIAAENPKVVQKITRAAAAHSKSVVRRPSIFDLQFDD